MSTNHPTPRPIRGWTGLDESPKPGTLPSPPRVGQEPPPLESKGLESVLEQRFRILRQLGRGGMATVYLCEDLALRSRAAVKVLDTRSCPKTDPGPNNAEMRQRFLEEATLLANLRHPHLVQILITGELPDGSPYIAMEYLGDSLDRRIAKGESLPWREVLKIAEQIADALNTLHLAGVVHRDVKPSNIAEIRGANGRTFVKLIDLGIARVEDIASVQQGGNKLPPRRVTQEGKLLGTPGFMPPEAGLSPPDPSFDVYGLGATIFRLITGNMHDPGEPRSMAETRPGLDLPADLEAVVRRALAALPEDRIGTAAELSRLLAAIHTNHASDPPDPLFDECYELIKLLGIGAKAEVHYAYHCDARRYVALKILGKGMLDDEVERARFDREARVLRALAHPSIPTLIECRTGPRRKRPFIAMSFCPGKTAAELGPAQLSLEEVLQVGLELASALAAMHEIGVIHRDLNRSNVLINSPGPSEQGPPAKGGHRTVHASIIDFGQVELEDRFYAFAAADERYPTPPAHRDPLGSGGLERLEWTAPEARETGQWTARSDVYSLGLLLFQLLTGKRPTKDEHGRWLSPAEFVPESSGPLANAILAALQVDPELRLDAKALESRLLDAAEEVRMIEAEEQRMRWAAKAEQQAEENAPEETQTSVHLTTSGRSTATPADSRSAGWAKPKAAAALVIVALLLIVISFGIGWSFGQDRMHDQRRNNNMSLESDQEDGPSEPGRPGSPTPQRLLGSSSVSPGPTSDTVPANLDIQRSPEDPQAHSKSTPGDESEGNNTGKHNPNAQPEHNSPTARRSAIKIANRWARTHDSAVQRCLGSWHAAKTLDITLRVDRSGALVGLDTSPETQPLMRRCLRAAFAEIKLARANTRDNRTTREIRLSLSPRRVSQ